VHDLGHLAEGGTRGVEYSQSHQLMVVVLVRVLRILQRIRVDEQQHAAECVRGVPIADAFQTHQKPPGMLPGGFDGDVAVGGQITPTDPPDESGPDGESLLG